MSEPPQDTGPGPHANQSNRSTELALRERVKELACLYGIAQLAATAELSLPELLQGTVDLLPPAWQYPDVTAARIVLDGREYSSPGFRHSAWGQTAAVIVAAAARGEVRVVYTAQRPDEDEGPFLKEERHLIDAVAQQVALIVERREAGQEKEKLQAQLRHADRLATIGVLAAGIAHELNEPLGNILGFAQLTKKSPGLPPQARSDLAKIEAASLHAREIIKKLLLFARQVPPQKNPMDLNRVVEECLSFFKTRCAAENVALASDLARDLPPIIGDPLQLNQVLTNLVVNALQAMPQGGRLSVRTRVADGRVALIVEDTGTGMAPEILEKLFIPFFTTKELGKGTGLGLSVVRGIVSAHGGTVRVESHVGRGTSFEFLLPISGSPDATQEP